MNEVDRNPILFLSSNKKYYIIPARLSQHRIIMALSAYTVERLSSASFLFNIYDTFDGRLAASDAVLLQLEKIFYLIDRKSGSYIESLKDLYQQYYYWQDFDDRMRMLKQKVENRALYAQLEIQIKRTTMRLLNADDKTVQICHFIRLIITARGKTRKIKLINTIPLRGYTHDLRWVEAQFSAMGMNEKKGSLVDFCLQDSGIGANIKFKPMLKKDQASWQAAQSILQMLNKIMQVNHDGVLKDIDTEFLHDFRVALRRIRTALNQLKSVLPQSEAVHFKAEFKSLQRATNRLRDLDVYLLNRSAYEEALPMVLRPGLVPFFDALSKSRRDEFDRVRQLFESEFDTLMERWAGFLYTDWQRHENLTLQNAPIKSLSDRLLNDGLDEILVEAAEITADTPRKQIHKIRIHCKNFRYICEFFHSLYPTEMKKVIAQFKELQDYLGRLNDLAVQQKQIMKFMQKLQPDVENQTIAALGGLVAVLNREFELMRSHIRSRFDDFARNVSNSFHV